MFLVKEGLVFKEFDSFFWSRYYEVNVVVVFSKEGVEGFKM